MNSNINISEEVILFDWIIFSLILLITFTFVFIGNYRQKKQSKDNPTLIDHLVMGRQLTLPLFVGTLVATWYGGIFGVTQIAFEKGIFNLITQGGFWYLSYLIFAFFLVDKVSRYEALTLPDLIGKMFGPKSAKVASLFNFFNVLPIAYTIGIGIFIQSLSGWSLNISMLVGLVIVLSYSLKGGLRSVVLSDMIQFYTMCTGVFAVLAFSIFKFGGLSFLQEKLPDHYFSLTSDVGLLPTLVWGFIALSTLVDPNFYQRCFAAHSPKVAKKGIIISTLIWFCFDICTTFGAMYARAVIPDAQSSQGYLIYALQLLPHGMKGFFLAAILATILSTLDSYLFLAGATLSFDLNHEATKKRPYLHALGIISVAIISIIMANLFSGNIKLVWKTLGSYSAGCFLFPVLYGHFSKRRIADNIFVGACLTGVVSMTAWSLISRYGIWAQIDSLYIGVLATSLFLFISGFFHTQHKSIQFKS